MRKRPCREHDVDGNARKGDGVTNGVSPRLVSSGGLLFGGWASAIIAASACALLAVHVWRSDQVEPAVILAAAGVAIGTLCGWQLLFWRLVRRTLYPVNEVASRLSSTVEADELYPLDLKDGNNIGGFVASLNRLICVAKEAKESSLELEFANRVLLHERDRVRGVLDSIGEGVLAVGLDERLIFANRAVERFLNLPANEATGKPLHECVRDPHVASLLNGDGDTATDAGDGIEVSLEGHDASSVFSVTVSTVTDADNEVAGKSVVFRDIADTKRAEQARQDFVNSVAHELRTPLTSIKAYVELLIDGEARDADAQREFYNVIYEETDRLNRLIDNLLNMSRMELGTVVVSRTPTRLKKLIEDSLSAVESQIAKKSIQLKVDLPDRLPAVEVDKDMMNVVLVNVLGNAVKYTPDNGHISISSTSTPDEILVHVSDTGIGIADGDLSRIFDKFYRCTAKQNADVPGSGLGLCIARQVMRLHGGDIRVSSRLGEGAQFTMVIPRSALVTSLGDYEHEGSNDPGR
jgi:two-component system phosphate regulon sensor histidine kinase PhoR